jgi:hypothetical protein
LSPATNQPLVVTVFADRISSTSGTLDAQLMEGATQRASLTGVGIVPFSSSPAGAIQPRTVTDGVTTNTSTTITSATANFVAADVGSVVESTNIPAGTTISSVTNSTTAILSAAATASGSSQSIIIDGKVTAAFNLIFPWSSVQNVSDWNQLQLKMQFTAA